MPTKTYYAKLDCYSNVTNGLNTAREYYKSFCDFMSYLTGSNVATLVAWHSGSGAASGSFNERTYWDEAKPFGTGSYGIWKFHTSSTRNWEWYLYAQDQFDINLNSSFYDHCQPILVYGQSLYVNGGDQTVIMQAAVCFSGSDSFNPWNGTITDGFSQATSPRWVSGSDDRTMYVLPRSNDLGGLHAANKQNGLTFGRIGYYNNSGAPRTMRFHFIYDGDALLVLNDTDNDSTYTVTYVGAFELRNSLSGAGISNSDHGFLMYTQVSNPLANTINNNSNFGNINGDTTTQNGGIAVPIGEAISGSKTAIPQGINNFLGTTYQPNTLINAYDEIPIYVGISESPFQSYLGTLNTGLVRYMVNVGSNDMKDDYTRAIVGGSTTLSNLKISIPWSGSIAIGVGTDRTGSNYTWTTNYG